MAILGTISTTIIHSEFPFYLAFVWLYGGAILVLHALRSLSNEKDRWRYGLHGFAAGIFFGPFGNFLRDVPQRRRRMSGRKPTHMVGFALE